MIGTSRRRFSVPMLVVVSLLGVLVGSVLTFGGLALSASKGAEANQQTMVHQMGAGVMPFDLDRTTHIFTMTETGGLQQVVVKSGTDAAQVQLIQQHLQHEAQRFASGDFSDPTALHGTAMPGVSLLSARATALTIRYMPLPNGGQIAFDTDDIRLMTAVHQWFGAQLSDHGRDAMSGMAP